MTELDFSFEEMDWTRLFGAMQPGARLSATRFLTLLERMDEAQVEEALLYLEVGGIGLEVSDLPKTYGSGNDAVRLRREEELVQKGALLERLEENDPLRLYLEEVAALPTPADVQVMAMRYAGGFDPLLPALTNAMLSTVIQMACNMTGRGVLLMDLIQEGSLGLWQGILSYRQGDFESHARWWIGQYLARAVTLQARQSGVGQKMKQAMEDFRAVEDRLLSQLGRNATLPEIADAMHMTLEEIQAVANMLESARLLQMAKPEEKEENPQEEAQAVENTAYFQLRQRVEELLSTLDQLDAQLLTLRFGLEGGLPLSPEDTGKRLGLTPEEVIAHEAAALAKLRQN